MLSTIVQTLRQRRGLLAFSVFVTALLFYVATLAPGLLWGGGDFSTFQTRVYTGEIEATNFGHPLWVVLARPFTWLPIRDIAYRVNLVSAVFAALTIVIVFYTARDLTRSIGASLLATGTLLVSHTFWTYATMPKPYSLNALMLAAGIYLLLRWARERRGLYLYIVAVIYGLSPLNHLIMTSALVGIGVYVLLIVWKHRHTSPLWKQIAIASLLFVISLTPYILLTFTSGEAEATGSGVSLFLTGFLRALVTPQTLLLALGLGVALLIYQFPLTLPISFLGMRSLRKSDRAASALLLLIILGDVAFLLGATAQSGNYAWNLHYYLLTYIVIALYNAIGFAELSKRLPTVRLRMAVILSVFVAPIAIYAIAPPIARAVLGEVPGFRELPGRDNYVYVLSPWKHNETGARTLGESILSTLPSNSVFFADYGIWSIINYLQIVENARPDIDLIMLPGAGSAAQLPLILDQSETSPLYMADTGRYYDIEDIETLFEIVAIGPIFQLQPR